MDKGYKFLTFNVRGLGCAPKRSSVFRIIKQQKANVVALQETYLEVKHRDIIERSWGHVIHFSAGSSHSKGIITLFSKEIKWENIKLKECTERFIISEIMMNNNIILIVNVYAPCEHS